LNIYIGDKYIRGKAGFSLGDNEEQLIRMGYKFFRKINHRKDFDDTVSIINKRIDNNTIGNIPQAKRGVLGNPDLSNLIGEFLVPSTSGKGGRRKRRGTRRTRKNKRKSTRRVRRK